ncbi:MAG: hypothetical protein WD757_00420 [Actinomycetota bacterium]
MTTKRVSTSLVAVGSLACIAATRAALLAPEDGLALRPDRLVEEPGYSLGAWAIVTLSALILLWVLVAPGKRVFIAAAAGGAMALASGPTLFVVFSADVHGLGGETAPGPAPFILLVGGAVMVLGAVVGFKFTPVERRIRGDAS